ncbi:Integral membrane protein [Coniochaeta hoffmannii]|uniref:Integral membrane protein n=1 Tax=Coniochaeta hoffmannii TaxID=91930 RepID=A0AA38RZD3_9PEZI|nr:Integral membrane protein [Coniochaeta hoffmannii]
MKFWGSRQDESRNGGSAALAAQDEHRAPDEHTRLLPNRLDSDLPNQYLSPDDPAVSPYNLFTVRLIRYITIFLAVLTFLWWTAQLVSTFVTPPGFHVRGGGFFGFNYASIALVVLIVSLVFFSAPSKSSRVFRFVMAALLLVHMIVILAVESTRHEEAWIGIASVVWALLMTVWTLVADYTVQWGKREEEERLTGRPETRRTVLEWTEVTLETICLIVLSAALVLITCTLVLRAIDASLAPPGQRYWVDDDKYQIHVFCYGNKTDTLGRPVRTVLFEGGEDPVEHGLWQFADNAVRNGSISRYCFADRPGYAWSDAAPSPLSASMATDALSEALARAGEQGPWVLASAGVGSIYSRVFSSRHGREVKGILMIDPLHEDLLGRVGRPGRGFMLWFQGVISPLGIDRIPGALFRHRNRMDRVWGRSAYQSGKMIFAKLQESLVAESLTKRDVTSSKAIQYQDTPVVVISSGDQIHRDSVWEEKQRDLTHLTRHLEGWDIVDKAPHQVWRTLEGREQIEKRLSKLVLH